MRPELYFLIGAFVGFYLGKGVGSTEGFNRACKKFEGLVENQAKEVQKVKEAHVSVNHRFDQLEPKKQERFS